MWLDVGSLAVLGGTLGGMLGVAAKYLAVEADATEAEIQALLPGSNCAQCGFVGCSQYAAALAAHETTPNKCAPGGAAVAAALAKHLGVSADMSGHEDVGPRVAFVNEDLCIGCLRCTQECSTDAIVGAAKQMHTVISELCHTCGSCVKVCSTEAISLVPIPKTAATWHWPKP